MSTENIEISFLQEPYIYQNRPKGISTGYRTYTHGQGKSRAAIIITNDTLDAIFITQYSDNDTLLLEIHKTSNTLNAASIYMEYNEQIDTKLQTIEQIIEFTKTSKLIIAIDINARSTI
jgi:SAM-dependent MidA family methyltransferase